MNPASTPYDVFFSYNSQDQDAVTRVAEALKETGLRVFMDRWYLVPGQPWPQALERELGKCKAVAIFLNHRARFSCTVGTLRFEAGE